MRSIGGFLALTKAYGYECVDISHLAPPTQSISSPNFRFFAVSVPPAPEKAARRKPRGGTRLADAIADFAETKNGIERLSDGRRWVAESLYKAEPNSLQALRLRNGLSQAELAKAIGVSQPRVSIYERGQEKPEFDTFIKLRDVLGISSDELIDAIQHASTRRASDNA